MWSFPQVRFCTATRVAVLLATVIASHANAQTSGAAAPAPRINDFPTYERVRYVLSCIDKNGGAPALVYQCSCAIDEMAARFSIDEFVDLQTALNSMTIAGERGGEVRDNAEVRADAKRYREAEAAAIKACGISRHG